MTRRAPPRPGVDRMVSTSWSGRRWSSPAARQGRALARGLEGRFPLQHHYVSDQNSSSSRCWAYFSLALKHGIYRDIANLFRAPTLSVQRKATCPRAPTQALGRPGVVSVAGMHVRSLYGNREVSVWVGVFIEWTVRGGKGSG